MRWYKNSSLKKEIFIYFLSPNKKYSTYLSERAKADSLNSWNFTKWGENCRFHINTIKSIFGYTQSLCACLCKGLLVPMKKEQTIDSETKAKK